MLTKRTIDEMITHFNEVVSEMDIPRKYKMTLLGMITAIGYETQKTANAVPVVHGEWIPQGSVDAGGNQYYICSVCQCGEEHVPSVKVSFCWNCGAKMGGKEQEE